MTIFLTQKYKHIHPAFIKNFTARKSEKLRVRHEVFRPLSPDIIHNRIGSFLIKICSTFRPCHPAPDSQSKFPAKKPLNPCGPGGFISQN